MHPSESTFGELDFPPLLDHRGLTVTCLDDNKGRRWEEALNAPPQVMLEPLVGPKNTLRVYNWHVAQGVDHVRIVTYCEELGP